MDGQEKKEVKAAALKYEQGKDEAPRLLARGQGEMAERILNLARDHNIPVHEDPALVEILSQMDILDQIPPECYRVVAEILAFIYKTHGAATLQLQNPAAQRLLQSREKANPVERP